MELQWDVHRDGVHISSTYARVAVKCKNASEAPEWQQNWMLVCHSGPMSVPMPTSDSDSIFSIPFDANFPFSCNTWWLFWLWLLTKMSFKDTDNLCDTQFYCFKIHLFESKFLSKNCRQNGTNRLLLENIIDLKNRLNWIQNLLICVWSEGCCRQRVEIVLSSSSVMMWC